jgi:hypothetical protein
VAERLSVIFQRLGVPGSTRERRRMGRVFLKLGNTLLLEALRQQGVTVRRTLDDLTSLLLLELTRERVHNGAGQDPPG